MPTYPALTIPDTLAAGPGPGNTDPRVLKRFCQSGAADHMQKDVIRGMIEAKHMLREVFGTENIHTFGVGGTGFSGLDCVLSMILPGDSVVVFVNGTFSNIDALTIRLKAATREELAANPMTPDTASVTVIEIPHGQSVTAAQIDAAFIRYKPLWAFMTHWETGSGRINDLAGFNCACAEHGVMGIADAVSSLGICNFRIDDYPAIVAWASCPQKGILSLPLTYAPVSFSDQAIELIRQRGCPTYVHHPILEARHWGIIDGKDVTTSKYHRTHSGYAVAAFHEALRILLNDTLKQKAKDYKFYERALRKTVSAMGCKVTSNMPSLLVLDLPKAIQGQERSLVATCREQGFGIWPTLSEPVQIRIGILNQLSTEAIVKIADLFADALLEQGAKFDKTTVMDELQQYFQGH